MLDPIGATHRIRELFLSYLETAFRIRDQSVSAARRQLLTRHGTLTTEPFLEPVPRYEQVTHFLQDLVLLDSGNPLRSFSSVARRAFVELALSGLFPGEASDRDDVRRTSNVRPYLHQWQMLERGVGRGMPGIVTSGTGSGKTESFMLPIFATIAQEAVRWPAPHGEKLSNEWYKEAGQEFVAQRSKESPGRPKAVRALLIYPMNALVEDQMTRLRRALDSDEATSVMDERFSGNRIFFGRYTGAAPVTGHLNHPRRANTAQEKRKRARRIETMRSRMSDLAATQTLAREHDARELADAYAAGRDAPEPTRFLFPSLDGAEMVTRWDMQATPPDILITNTSMLATMLVREVDEPIFTSTRKWLEENDDAYFFLVMDELHLVRGSAGMEVVGLLRSLFAKLGLDRPEHRHKVRILASSASLPDEGPDSEVSLQYLFDFFGSFGSSREPGDAGFDTPADWRHAIVRGRQLTQRFNGTLPLATEPFVELAAVLDVNGADFAPQVSARTSALDVALARVARALGIDATPTDVAAALPKVIAAASSAIVHACTTDDGTSGVLRATAVSDFTVDPAKVDVTFADGGRLTARLLVGADGVWSTLRGLANGGGGASRFAGELAWRTTAPAGSAAAGLVARLGGAGNVVAILHPGFHMIAYPVSGGEAFNLVAFTKGERIEEGWSGKADPEILARAMRGTAPELARLAGDAAPWLVWPLHTVDQRRPWVMPGGVALIGDAAHAMTPFAAQGAAMAIEDAETLAASVPGSPAGATGALAAWERERKARVARVARRGALNHLAWHAAGPVALARDVFLRLRRPESLAADMDWLYGWRVPEDGTR